MPIPGAYTYPRTIGAGVGVPYPLEGGTNRESHNHTRIGLIRVRV
jgi:hypothetical protein